jgi:hypothetical protein
MIRLSNILVCLCLVALTGCSFFSREKMFTICTADGGQCFTADTIKVDGDCVFSDDSMICGPYTAHRNYLPTVNPLSLMPKSSSSSSSSL